MARKSAEEYVSPVLRKIPTGITGLDEILKGGLPEKRVSLIAGNAGTGKSVLGMEFLFNGITLYDEPGVLVSFEEKPEQIISNFSTFGWDLAGLQKKKKFKIIHFDIGKMGHQVSDDFDLGGIFARLEMAIKSIGAKRIVFDTLENLYVHLAGYAMLRKEIERIFNWIKDEKKLTAIVTAEATGELLSHSGLEQFVSDCVINLGLTIQNRKAIRKLQVLKYRGSDHDANQTPFDITGHGFYVFPLSSIKLAETVSSRKVSTGIAELDNMLGGKGIYRGSTLLITGSAGTGKGTLSAHFVDGICRKGGTALYLSFEESPQQICRNMKSIGIDLQQWIDKGRLSLISHRVSEYSLESYLVNYKNLLDRLKPEACVIDPISAFLGNETDKSVDQFAMHLVDMAKRNKITCYLTSLTQTGIDREQYSGVTVSSIADAWIQLRQQEVNYERILLMYVVKSRGADHTNMVREFKISGNGITFSDLYVTEDGILTGMRRVAHINKVKSQLIGIEHEIIQLQSNLESHIQESDSARDKAANDVELERVKLEYRLKQLETEKELLLLNLPQEESGQ